MRNVAVLLVVAGVSSVVACSSDDGDPAVHDSTPAELCTEECRTAGDGECDDGGSESLFDVCQLGTDCLDCGPRTVSSPAAPPPNPTGGAGTGGSTSTPPGVGSCECTEVGASEGDCAEDWTLTDQNGVAVSLSDYCGEVVYLAMGAMWCPGCQAAAGDIPGLMADYGSQGFIALNLMAETTRGDAPDAAALTAWAEQYSLSTPVLADPNWGVWNRYWPEGETPKEMLVGRDGRIIALGWVDSRDIESAL